MGEQIHLANQNGQRRSFVFVDTRIGVSLGRRLSFVRPSSGRALDFTRNPLSSLVLFSAVGDGIVNFSFTVQVMRVEVFPRWAARQPVPVLEMLFFPSSENEIKRYPSQ